MLTCKICQHKALDLVPHIETKHPEITLETYMANDGIDSVIHPSLQGKEAPMAEAAPVKAKTAVAAPGAKVMIAGMEMAQRPARTKPEHQAAIPKASPHYEFQSYLTKRAILNIEAKYQPILLVGHTGSGKTSLPYELAARIGQPVIRANLNQQTTYADLIGQWTVQGGNMVWVDGILPFAAKNGFWLILDEIDYADPNILCSLNGVLDKNPSLNLKEKGREEVEIHPNFRIFGTGNGIGCMQEFRHLYQGSNLMNEAWIDRWLVLKVDYLNEEQEAKVMAASIAKLSINVAKELVKVANMVRKAFVEETVTCTFSTRRLFDWSEATIAEVMMSETREEKAEAPIRAAEYTVFNKIKREEAQAIEGMMRRVLMGRERS